MEKSNILHEWHASYQAYLILLCFANNVAFSLQTEGLWQFHVEQVYQHHFSNNICSLHVSVSYFGNSLSISNFFIIILFVMMICDQWSLILQLWLMEGSDDDGECFFFSNTVFL